MEPTPQEIADAFGNHLRVRVCGICLQGDSILLVKHTALAESKYFWSPPGGGMHFASSAGENLKREFIEETGLEVKVNDLLVVHEFLRPPLHAVELFFHVEITGGTLRKGSDPEMPYDKQLINEVCFVPFAQLIDDEENRFHNIFSLCSHPDELLQYRGYVLFDKNIKIGM
ncbi:MAG: NUDIX hydrolase [Cyclobacteriaceae bacterium]|nr:NUDIX hydrolase [Cyclobacteriaceae bacterium]